MYILIKISCSAPIFPPITRSGFVALIAANGETRMSINTMIIINERFLDPSLAECSIVRRIPSKISANNAAGMAPNKIKLLSLRSIPSKIKLPSPPAPIRATIVAVPIMSTIAVRIPAIMTGSARGSSTLINRLHEFIPMALDASIKDGSTSLIPVYVFRTIGRSEYKNSAITAGKVPIPTRGISNPNKASEGMVCSTAVTPMIGSAMRSCLVKYSPSGTEINTAITRASTEI